MPEPLRPRSLGRWRRFGVTDSNANRIVRELWNGLADERTVTSFVEVSANVSTNRVFMLRLSDDSRVFAKVSNYGSPFLFREDHDRVARLHDALAETRWANFLAPPVRRRQLAGALGQRRVHTISDNEAWGVLYAEVERRATLPAILSSVQITNLAEEVAEFHKASDEAAQATIIPRTSTSITSDIVHLLDLVSDRTASKTLQLTGEQLDIVRRHANRFLQAMEDLGYADMDRIPVLVDWNLGNFSVAQDSETPDRFKLFSRWDYDWFRIDTRLLDFYFLSRVSSLTGDRSVFSYGVHTLGEPPFRQFLTAYHRINPLSERDLAFIVETYRFFILHYVLSVGDHFFRHDLWNQFRIDAVTTGLPSIDRFDPTSLKRALD